METGAGSSQSPPEGRNGGSWKQGTKLGSARELLGHNLARVVSSAATVTCVCHPLMAAVTPRGSQAGQQLRLCYGDGPRSCCWEPGLQFCPGHSEGLAQGCSCPRAASFGSGSRLLVREWQETGANGASELTASLFPTVPRTMILTSLPTGWQRLRRLYVNRVSPASPTGWL